MSGWNPKPIYAEEPGYPVPTYGKAPRKPSAVVEKVKRQRKERGGVKARRVRERKKEASRAARAERDAEREQKIVDRMNDPVAWGFEYGPKPRVLKPKPMTQFDQERFDAVADATDSYKPLPADVLTLIAKYARPNPRVRTDAYYEDRDVDWRTGEPVGEPFWRENLAVLAEQFEMKEGAREDGIPVDVLAGLGRKRRKTPARRGSGRRASRGRKSR